MPAYGADLAHIHQAGFSGFALNAAPGLLRILRQNGIDRGFIVDLGCGNGILARQFGFAGYDVLGVDASPEMIRLARKTAPKASFAVGSLGRARIPGCNAITATGEVCSYAFAEDASGKQLSRFLGRVYRALRPGGILAMDFATTGRHPAGMARHAHWSGRDWAVMVDSEEDPSRGLIRRRLTAFRKIGKLYRRSDETHLLRLYDTSAMEEAVAAAGFTVRRLTGYGDLRFGSGHAGVLGRKLAS